MNTISRTQLLGMNCHQLEEYLLQVGQHRYRGRQIYKWIYQKDVNSFYEMSDIPKELRQQLDEISVVSIPRVLKQRVSKDGTRKFLMELDDRKRIETVVIPQGEEREARYSLCISTQVGCPVGCAFCATGTSGYQRSLQSYEMVGQFLSSRRELKRRLKKNDDSLISNVVYMGMGEPFFNYDQVIASVYLLIDPQGINIGQRHITISTSGEVKGIKRLAEENLQVTLAISLHATNDHLRDQLVPLNRKYSLDQLIEAVDYYIKKTNRRVTFEYVMLDDVNISRVHADQLIKMVKPLLANINLIPYNEVEILPFKKPSSTKVWQFYHWLVEGGLNVTIREERGGDIEAACGQLYVKER
ncbi:MAG TPA: 23S rRNA (adenine(2503)-C(2))-methyltransferase RlmN [Syntrophomonadaceae bacterium]|nr:23S rRNA (adenine(2503)-C(2))-methyltransferase RlmN [Syntrophomonadaceae bacterium]HQE22537.1 23S rRNA (adenine(2503)-C(2))-methyltransferase RlmN [Syntrophomonadaceae bacterium]